MWEPGDDGTTDWAIYGLTKQLSVPGAGQYPSGAIFALCTECTMLAGAAASIHDWIAIVSRSPRRSASRKHTSLGQRSPL